MFLLILELVSVLTVIIYYTMNIYITWRSNAIKDQIVKYAFDKYVQERRDWVWKKYSRYKLIFWNWLSPTKDAVLIEYPEIEMKLINLDVDGNEQTIEEKLYNTYEIVDNKDGMDGLDELCDWVDIQNKMDIPELNDYFGR